MSAPAIAQIKLLLVTPEPAGLGPESRSGVLSVAALNAKLDVLFGEIQFTLARRELIRSLLLLWHDHLDASHDISQGIENADGSFVHAIMHRREPDAWNSKYWWRRVGKHPAFPVIASRVSELLNRSRYGESAILAHQIVPDGHWDALAFVDACDSTKDKSIIQTLREIQRIETEVLLEFFCHE